jgi:hypothetical protein
VLARLLVLLFALLPLLVGRGEVVQHLCKGKVIEVAACCCEQDRQPGVTMPDTCCHDEARSMATPGMPSSSWPDPSPPALIEVAAAVRLVPMLVPSVPSEVPGQGFALHERGPPPPRNPLFLRIRTLLV